MPVERILRRLGATRVLGKSVPLLLIAVLSACGGGDDHETLLIEIFDPQDLVQPILTITDDDIADVELHTGGAAHNGALITLKDPTDLIRVRTEIPWGDNTRNPRFRVAVGDEALWGWVVLAGTSAATDGPQLIIDPRSGADPHGIMSSGRIEAVDSIFLLTSSEHTLGGENLKEAVYAAWSD